MVQFDILETERLTLKKLDPNRFNQVFQTCDKAEIMALLGLHSEEEFIKERTRFESGPTMFNKSFVNFLICKKGQSEVIGACGFHTWYLNHHRAEVGYALTDDAHKRQGIMFEALKRVLQYGFDDLHLNRVEAFVGKDNEASIRLLQILEFTQEGIMRQHYFKHGKSEDSIVFSLLRHEYRK